MISLSLTFEVFVRTLLSIPDHFNAIAVCRFFCRHDYFYSYLLYNELCGVELALGGHSFKFTAVFTNCYMNLIQTVIILVKGLKCIFNADFL